MAVTLERPSAVRVSVYDVLGREAAVLHAGALAAGPQRWPLPPGLPAGLYVVRAEGTAGQAARRVTVLR